MSAMRAEAALRASIAAVLVATTAIGALPLRSAFADDDAAAVAAARELGKEGVLLAEDGKCKEAMEKLSKAESLHHAPTILERLGECQVSLGKIVDGTETLQRVVREPLGANPPAAFVAAVERAKKVLAVATPKIAKLTIDVKAPAGSTPTVRLDGETVSSAMIGVERPTDPGHHELEARVEGWTAATAVVDLAPGATSKVSLAIGEKLPENPAPIASASTAPTSAPPPAATTTTLVDHPSNETPRSTSKLPAYVALGMGAVGLVVGTAFGVLAMSKKSSLDGSCDAAHRCPTSEQSDLDAARRDANVSTVGFGVAVVGGLVGGALLLFGPSSAPSTTSAHVTPTIGLGTIGVRGAF